ncbi:MAG: PspC domain-containing protein [Planctomycetota bacterium]|jgi:phage shock protein C
MKRLYRSETDAKIAGVCGGLGEEFGIDSNIVRLATVFACVVSGVAPLVVTYIVAWIILSKGKPQEQ